LHRHTARFAQPYGRGLARGPRLSAFITALAATAYAPCPAPAGIGLQTAGTQTPFQSTWLSGALAVPLHAAVAKGAASQAVAGRRQEGCKGA